METHRKTLEEEGMNLGSGKCLAEMSHLDEHKVTAFHGKLDLNLAVSKDGIEGHGQENDELGDRNEVNLNLQEHHGLDNDEEKSTKIGYDVNRLLSDQKEDQVMSGKGSDIFSSPVQAETFNNELGNEDPVHFSMEVPEAVDSRYQPENRGKENCPHDGELKENSRRKSRESLQFENSKSAFEEMEGGDGHVLGKLDGDYEAKMEDTYHSGKLVSTKGKLEGKNADLPSPGRTLESSVSPVRHMSVSPEKGPDVESSAGLKLSSSRHGVQDSSYSPRSFGPKHSPSPESPGEDGKIVLSQDHPAIFMRRSSTSPRRRCGQDSLCRDESLQKSSSISPRRRHISPDHRRRDRSVSRSPARGNDSSSRYGRRYRDRSRSRSPRARDHYRRSPRRYSPRRKSPPSGYHSRRHSPRRRPWSPPPNRSNGIGKPGNNLFVAGFSFMTTERDLERKFSRFGRVRDVRIVRDKRSGDSRGFGFLSLERDEDADAAIRALDQTEWNGRVVLVEKSKSR